MNTQLIFLHIPKTAGTAFRNVVEKNYPYDHYWWGLSEEQEYLDDYGVIGGHKPYQYYSGFLSNKLYLGIVREPVSRILSLHNYYANPTYNVNAPNKWINELGLDPRSIVNTIKNSRDFRDKIDNYQCYYLSGERNFEKARKVIESHDFIVGCMDHIDLFMQRIKKRFDWATINLPMANEGAPDYSSQYNQDEELLELLHEYTDEDRKLYEYVLEHKVFEHINPHIICDLQNIDKARETDLTPSLQQSVQMENLKKEIATHATAYIAKEEECHSSDHDRRITTDGLQKELTTAHEYIASLHSEINRFKQSLPWKLLSPLRKAKHYLNVLHGKALVLMYFFRDLLRSPVQTLLKLAVRLVGRVVVLRRLAAFLVNRFPGLKIWILRYSGYTSVHMSPDKSQANLEADLNIDYEVLPLRARRIYNRIQRR